MPERSTGSAKLELRLSPETKETRQAAAHVANRSLNEFVLESALELATRFAFRGAESRVTPSR